MEEKKKTISIGSRESRLAKVQVDEVLALLAKAGIKPATSVKWYKTAGDHDQKTTLTQNTKDDFFTDTLDQALKTREIDIAVHSAKDLPEILPQGLSIYAITKSIDDTDAFVGRCSFAELGAGSKVGTSSLIRKAQIKKLRPELQCVDIRGSIDERLKLIDAKVCDGIIVATCALKRLGLEKKIKDIMGWEAAPLQGALAIVGRQEDSELQELFGKLDVRRTYGRVVLVGAGPGDSELITLKGVKYLNKADYVFYDYLINRGLLKHAPRAEKVYVGKRKGEHSLPQEELSRMLKEKAQAGKLVVRLKGGDPLIFGRGGDEIEYLNSYHIDVVVVPGVSSATAIPSLLNVPLTARGYSSSVAFISGHDKDEGKKGQGAITIPQVDTIVFLMGLTKLGEIVRSLTNAGWKKDTPILIVSRGTFYDEAILFGTLDDIIEKAKNLRPPALIVVGQTVNFYKRRPKGNAILYTGTSPQHYEAMGHIIHLPMIEIKKADIDQRSQRHFIEELNRFDMVLFTSRFAVTYFFEMLKSNDYPLEQLQKKEIIAIGEHTAAALRECAVEPNLVAKDETSEGLFAAMQGKFVLRGKRIIFPRSSLANPYLSNMLGKHGARVKEIPIYQNVKPPKRPLPVKGIDRVIFTSPSTVHNFLKDYQRIPDEWKIISKGPLTTKTLEQEGYECEVIENES